MGLIEQPGRPRLSLVTPQTAPPDEVTSLVDRRFNECCRQQQSALMGRLTGGDVSFDELVKPVLAKDPVIGLVSSLIHSGILQPSPDDEVEINVSDDLNNPCIMAAARLALIVESVFDEESQPEIDIVTFTKGDRETLALLYMPDAGVVSPISRPLFFTRKKGGQYKLVPISEVAFWKPAEDASVEHLIASALKEGVCALDDVNVICIEILSGVEKYGGSPGGGGNSMLPPDSIAA